MQEQLISLETAKLAKQKNIIFKNIFRFNYSCYLLNGELKNDDNFPEEQKLQSHIPTQSLLQKWLRDVHNIYVVCIPSYLDDNLVKERFFFEISFERKTTQLGHKHGYYDTYEEALEIGLVEALNLINV